MYEDTKSKISQLEKVLNARDDLVTKKIKRHSLHNHTVNVDGNWDEHEFDIPEDESDSPTVNRKETWPIKVLFGSAVFFITALVIFAYNFWGGGNLVSGNNIVVTVKTPVSVSGGDIVPLEIEIKNNNKVSLLNTDLDIDFPLGVQNSNNTSLAVSRVQDFLGDILPGQSVKKNISVAIFGVENEKKDITINLSYKIAGSNSLFNKTKAVSLLINSSPVNIIVKGPTEINTNQTVDFTVEISSNSSTIIKNLLLKVDYPFGYVPISANPKNFDKNDLWLIGDLTSGEKRIIKLSGILTGQEGEERGFNFSIGQQADSDSQTISVPINSSFSTITIRQPFVSAGVSFNGQTVDEYISTAGSKIETTINWRNNLAYDVSDVSLIIKLNGNIFDKSSVQVNEGYYRSIDNTIIFDKTTNKNLAVLEPGARGTSKFTFNSFGIGTVTGSNLSNPIISFSIDITGKRVDYNTGEEKISFSDSRKIKITADPKLSAKILYYTGPFENRGSIPPKAEKETTYSITWTVTNPLNNLSNAKVSAVLPPYVQWLSISAPSQENIDYNSSTRTVSWSIGNISAGAGIVSPAKEVSFQISFLPSINQIGKVPVLIEQSLLTAKDNFTLTPVSDLVLGLNTILTSDPYFQTGGQTVVQ